MKDFNSSWRVTLLAPAAILLVDLVYIFFFPDSSSLFHLMLITLALIASLSLLLLLKSQLLQPLDKLCDQLRFGSKVTSYPALRKLTFAIQQQHFLQLQSGGASSAQSDPMAVKPRHQRSDANIDIQLLSAQNDKLLQQLSTESLQQKLSNELSVHFLQEILISAPLTHSAPSNQALGSLLFLLDHQNNLCSDSLNEKTLSFTLWQLIDDVLYLFHSARKIVVAIDDNCPTQFTVDRPGLARSLYTMLVDCLSRDCLQHLDEFRLEVRFLAQQTLQFNILEHRVEVECRDFTHKHSDESISGIIICPEGPLRNSLESRFKHLGLSIAADFNCNALQLCLVATGAEDLFRNIERALPTKIKVLMMGDANVPTKTHWHLLGNPVSQAELENIVCSLQSSQQVTQQYSILAVDDNPANLQLIRVHLEQMGHQISCANSGAAAIELCSRDQYDLILMDIEMPEMDGLQTMKHIHSEAKVVGLTASMSNEQHQKYLLAGLSEVLIKPISAIQIEELLDGLGKQNNVSDTRLASKRPKAAMKNIDEVTFDAELSLQIANHNIELAAELLQMLLANLTTDQRDINEAFDQGNLKALKAAVHKLHGAVNYCGLPNLANAIVKLDTILATSNIEHIATALDVVNHRITQLNNWSRQHPAPFEKSASKPANESGNSFDGNSDN